MNTIEIRTAQNVVIEYELAALRERATAFLLDALMVLFFYALMLGLLGISLGGSGLISLLLGLFPIILFVAYQLFSEVAANGQSWGKKRMGIRVVRLDGQEPGLSDYLLRAVFHIVDTVLSGTLLAALFISSSSKHQRLGDMAANTTVIRLRQNLSFKLEDILSINSLDNYELSYPEVRDLPESDILLIKATLTRYRLHRNPAHHTAVLELSARIQQELGISEAPRDHLGFLNTLVRDYIVSTR